MKRFGVFIAALLLSFTALPAAAVADDKATVQTFYDFLSNPASEAHADTFRSNVTSDWKSIGDYSGKTKNAGAFIGQLGFFAKLIPDMNWKVEEMIRSGDQIIVRGRASGTPNGPLFGVDGMGKSFVIMSIDIHTLQDGRTSVLPRLRSPRDP